MLKVNNRIWVSIDNEDYLRLVGYKWYAWKKRYTYYAFREERPVTGIWVNHQCGHLYIAVQAGTPKQVIRVDHPVPCCGQKSARFFGTLAAVRQRREWAASANK